MCYIYFFTVINNIKYNIHNLPRCINFHPEQGQKWLKDVRVNKTAFFYLFYVYLYCFIYFIKQEESSQKHVLF
jgi:predicted secreted acid phosphatase